MYQNLSNLIKWTHSKNKFLSNKLEVHSQFTNKRSKDENKKSFTSSTTDTIDEMQMKILKSDVVHRLGCLIFIQETHLTMELLWPNLIIKSLKTLHQRKSLKSSITQSPDHRYQLIKHAVAYIMKMQSTETVTVTIINSNNIIIKRINSFKNWISINL